MNYSQRRKRYAWLFRHPYHYMLRGSHIKLRPYQNVAARAVINSVRQHLGLTFVWIFPRQSGKDETLAQMLVYLLMLTSKVGGEYVFINPTFTPQTETSMRRLEARLKGNGIVNTHWKRIAGYIYTIGNSYCTFMSADPSAHIVSATANRLLLVNEAQDVDAFKFDKEIDPMAASTNATRLFSGTRWTSDTLLERELQRAQAAEAQDGLRRVFFYTAEHVRKYVPAYGVFVDNAIARLGRQHPLVKTQYFCETVDAQIGMFPPGRQVLMRGAHTRRTEPQPAKVYAFLIDVAGQDEAFVVGANGSSPILKNPGRDATCLKIVELDQGTVPVLGKPTYLVQHRRAWIGAKHVAVFGAIQSLANLWHPVKIVIDATGVGEGLWSLLDNAFGADVVSPVKFTPQSKSDLGYGLIGIIESGRYLEYHPFPDEFTLQLNKCRAEILPGPGKLMRWGVPDGTRDPASGEQVHDDDLITASLCTILDRMEWIPNLSTGIVPGRDPLLDMDRNF